MERCRQVRGLEWDPFRPDHLATGGADGAVKYWSIPTGGLSKDLATPLVSLSTCEYKRGGRTRGRLSLDTLSY